MYQEEMKSSGLAKFLNEYDYVFVDTCSLMEDTFPLFMDKLVSSKEYWREELQVIVLGECVDELKKHSKEKNKERASSRLAATRALKILRHDRWHSRALTITKPLGESFADNAIYTRVSGLRIHNKILVITQDKTLTTDLLKMNNLDSQKGRYLSVYRINQDSELEKNPGETSLKQSFNKKRDASSFQKVEKDTNKPRELTKLQKNILQADERITKMLPDPNCKLKNKIKEIEEQISRLKKGNEQIKDLKLNFSREELIVKKSELLKEKSSKKKEKKEYPTIKESTSFKTGEGKLPSEALRRLALNYNTILRGSSVPYFPEIHGELDLSEDDLTNVDVLGAKGGNFVYKKGDKTYFFVFDKNYSVSLNKKEEKQPKSKEEIKPIEKKKPLQEKKQPSKKEKNQKEKTQPKENENLTGKKVKIVKVRGSVSGGSSSAIPEGIILVVGESKKKKVPSKAQDKSQPSKKDDKLIVEARLYDKTLNANLHNPNYPKDKSLKEISKQKERLKKLKKEDTKDFQLSLSDLEKLEKAKK